MFRKIHEWLAEHTDLVQYPRPRRIYARIEPHPSFKPTAPFAQGLILLLVGVAALIGGGLALVAGVVALKVIFFG